MTASTPTSHREDLAQQAVVMELVGGYLSALEANEETRRATEKEKYLTGRGQDDSQAVRDAMSAHFDAPGYAWRVDVGVKYLKVVQTVLNENSGPGQGSVHAFVDKMTGEVYKAAGWAKPAKGVRYDLMDPDSREALYARAEFTGGYLYAR